MAQKLPICTFIFAAATVLLPCFTGCATHDAQASGLMQQVERNPSPTAVVGMWHTNTQNLKTTLLFKSDGQVFVKDTNVGGQDHPVESYSYSYKGNGLWEIESAEGAHLHVYVANDRLITETPRWLKTKVFERVQQPNSQFGSQGPLVGNTPAAGPGATPSVVPSAN